MDQFDQATELETQAREIALKQRQPEGPKATGRCLWCDEPLPGGMEGGMRWCMQVTPGDSCRDEWEYEQRRRGAQ